MSSFHLGAQVGLWSKKKKPPSHPVYEFWRRRRVRCLLASWLSGGCGCIGSLLQPTDGWSDATSNEGKVRKSPDVFFYRPRSSEGVCGVTNQSRRDNSSSSNSFQHGQTRRCGNFPVLGKREKNTFSVKTNTCSYRDVNRDNSLNDHSLEIFGSVEIVLEPRKARR